MTTTTLRFKELLVANRAYVEGMNLENSIHGFKMRLGRTYFIFFLLWFLILLPVSAILHSALAEINTHILIIMTALLTGAFFISFSMFREYLIERIVLKIIKKAWERHLGLFEFKEYSKDVANYYGQAVEEEIGIGDLQRFIFDKLSS
jgi:hypothetical protein